MSDTASLVIRVDSDPVEKADKRLEHIGHTAGHTEKATDELAASLKELALAYLSVEGAIKFTEKLFDVTKEFQVLSAQIKIAVGDGQDVAGMFEQLQEIAGRTPFQLKEVTDAFTLLVNRGLDPGTEALESYAKTATALNTSLASVTESVAQAAQGQFRGLQQLGIKVNETADGLILTFHGVNTTIKKDAEEIQKYIQDIGNTRFSGALEERSKTLEGAVSDLHKAWDELFISISKAGAGDLLSIGIHLATDAIKELRDIIASGELMAAISAVGTAFTGWGTDAEIGLTVVIALAKEAGIAIKTHLGGVGEFLKDAFLELPENIRYIAQLAGIAFAGIKSGFEIVADLLKSNMFNAFVFIVKEAENVGKEIARLLNPFSSDKSTFAEDTAKAFALFSTHGTTALVTALNATAALGEAIDENIDSIDRERITTIAASTAASDAAKKKREEYEQEKRVREELSKFFDPLEGARPKTPIGHINTSEEASAFEALKKSLQLQEVSINESYLRRRELIINNTKGNAALQAELEGELNATVNEEYFKAYQDRVNKINSLENDINDAIANGRLSQVDDLQTQLTVEEDLLKKSYELRKKQILSDTSTTESEKAKLIDSITKRSVQNELEQARQKQKLQLDQAAGFFGNLATIGNAFGRKGFEAAKAASIVQATIKTYESATSAYAALAGIPYIGPALGVAAAAAAIAAGVANVSAIRSQTYSGAYDTGGHIPAGNYGLIQEKGAPEFVQGPANITSRARTAELMGSGNSAPSQTTINVQNFAGVEVETQTRDTDTGKQIDILLKRVDAHLTAQAQNGGTPFMKSMERSYALKRGAA